MRTYRSEVRGGAIERYVVRMRRELVSDLRSALHGLAPDSDRAAQRAAAVIRHRSHRPSRE